MSSVMTVFDGIRVIADWSIAGSTGNGPLKVPYPARAGGYRGGMMPPRAHREIVFVDVEEEEDGPTLRERPKGIFV